MVGGHQRLDAGGVRAVGRRRLGRHDERGRQRRPQRAPARPGRATPAAPCGGNCDQRSAFFKNSARSAGSCPQIREGADALARAAAGGNLSKDCRVFSICGALGVGQRVERLLFFLRRQFKKLVELRGDSLAFVLGQRLPARLRGVARSARWGWCRRGVRRIHVHEILQRALVVQKFLARLRRQGVPLLEPRFATSPRKSSGTCASRAARSGRRFAQQAAADTSAIPSRAAAVRARPGPARGIRGPWRGCGRGFPAGGWSGNSRAPPASSPAVAGNNITGDRACGAGGIRFVGTENDSHRRRRNVVESWAGSGKTAIWRRRAKGEPPKRLTRTVHCRLGASASSSSSARAGWPMRWMASKFFSASTLGSGSAAARARRSGRSAPDGR